MRRATPMLPLVLCAALAGASGPAAAAEPIEPSLSARVDGVRVLGARLRLEGRLLPAAAGTLNVTIRGVPKDVEVAEDGRYGIAFPSDRVGRECAAVALAPAPGYVAVDRRVCVRIGTPTLTTGSRGAAVHEIERRLHGLRYAIRHVDGRYGADTRDAVLAFEKVERLERDGIAGPAVWRALLDARTPRAAARGTHIEVDKTRQVLFEVRRGRVVKVAHVSTGATGNTPVGRWRIYLKTPGYNALGMYDSMYFLRGFAIHGYASVPPYPASHGCVRVPLWFAPRIYARWDVGSRVLVLA